MSGANNNTCTNHKIPEGMRPDRERERERERERGQIVKIAKSLESRCNVLNHNI